MHAHPNMNVIFRPYKSAIRPRKRRRHPCSAREVIRKCGEMNGWKEGRRVLTELREYAEMSHCSLDSGMSRSLPMVGSEMETAVMFEVWRCHLYMHIHGLRV